MTKGDDNERKLDAGSEESDAGSEESAGVPTAAASSQKAGTDPQPPERPGKERENDKTETEEPKPEIPRWLVAVIAGAVLLSVLLCLVLLAVRLGPKREPGPEPVPAAGFDIRCDPISAEAEKAAQEAAQVPHAYFPPSQLIVTGPQEEMVQTVRGLEEIIPLTPVRSCTVDYGNATPSDDERGDQLVMSLYTIGDTDGPDTGEEEPIAQQLKQMADALRAFEKLGPDRGVYADPNFFVGILGQSACGSPHGIGPSPHGIGPSPHGIGPSPIPGSGPGPIQDGALELFRTQWAFDHIGLSPWPSGSGPVGDSPTGAGILVGVLDTSPFDETDFDESGVPKITLGESDGVSPNWTIGLRFPDLHLLEPSSDVQAEYIGDHGLFASSLIHALAPEAQVRLVRVLDEYGCGTLFDLNVALFEFLAEVEAEQADWDGAVINLSLGLQRPLADSEVAPQLAQESQDESTTTEPDLAHGIPGTWTRSYNLEEVEAAKGAEQVVPVGGKAIYIDDDVRVIAEDTVESLQEAIAEAHKRDVIVVAAAGNDSGVDRIPRPPQLPAAYPSVIGVAGTNISRERSCFSNWGDVSAPAGEGGENLKLMAELEEKWPGVYESDDCLPITDLCQDECPAGLIGLIWDNPSKYAYWSGTSFAAPLVSGLAAQLADAGAEDSSPWLSPDEAFAAIRCGAPTPDGEIDVPATLERCGP